MEIFKMIKGFSVNGAEVLKTCKMLYFLKNCSPQPKEISFYQTLQQQNISFSFVGGKGYAEYSFSVSTPPLGGTCHVNPLTGEAVRTQFSVICTKWKGQSTTLQYHYFLLTNHKEANSSSQDVDSIERLLSFGHSSEVQFTLPAGKAEDDFTQILLVRISDSYAATTEVRLFAQVGHTAITVSWEIDVEIIPGLTNVVGSFILAQSIVNLQIQKSKGIF